MAAGAPTLNQGPPLPPNLQPAPQASAGQLAGPPPGQAQSSGSAALLNKVTEKVMFVQKTLEEIGMMMPAAAPVAQGVIDLMQKGMGALIAAQGAQPPPDPGAGAQGMMMQSPTAPGA